ncbi:hypothetical protein J3459_003820 [Metarhizium acridum]|uniref:uncharacterized protein n=1 Tax=Metarhizium acridum TaxID=92637 RepID=UPI001C6B0A1A|nr:hypothetical protein J3458_002752 [Metarhizium acridum]KAG8428541.1 hypothetical protein J3459_003820 [Metarhizium acridum]
MEKPSSKRRHSGTKKVAYSNSSITKDFPHLISKGYFPKTTAHRKWLVLQSEGPRGLVVRRSAEGLDCMAIHSIDQHRPQSSNRNTGHMSYDRFHCCACSTVATSLLAQEEECNQRAFFDSGSSLSLPAKSEDDEYDAWIKLGSDWLPHSIVTHYL